MCNSESEKKLAELLIAECIRARILKRLSNKIDETNKKELNASGLLVRATLASIVETLGVSLERYSELRRAVEEAMR